MTAKVRIKVGQFEIDYEGDEKFLEKDLVDLVTQIADVFKDREKILAEKSSATSSGRMFDDTLTTNTIATKMDVKSGSDLALAASGYLALVARKDTFLRNEIVEQMKEATTFYKASYSRNMTQYLNTLVKTKKQLNLVGKDRYALTAEARQDLEAKLA